MQKKEREKKVKNKNKNWKRCSLQCLFAMTSKGKNSIKKSDEKKKVK